MRVRQAEPRKDPLRGRRKSRLTMRQGARQGCGLGPPRSQDLPDHAGNALRARLFALRQRRRAGEWR